MRPLPAACEPGEELLAVPVQQISTECGVLFTSKALHIVGCSQRPWSTSALGSSAGLLSRICSVSPPWRRPRRLAARIHLPEARVGAVEAVQRASAEGGRPLAPRLNALPSDWPNLRFAHTTRLILVVQDF